MIEIGLVRVENEGVLSGLRDQYSPASVSHTGSIEISNKSSWQSALPSVDQKTTIPTFPIFA